MCDTDESVHMDRRFFADRYCIEQSHLLLYTPDPGIIEKRSLSLERDKWVVMSTFFRAGGEKSKSLMYRKLISAIQEGNHYRIGRKSCIMVARKDNI